MPDRVGRAFWMPAGQAMTPNLVPVEAFPGAVALNSMLSQAAVIVGPALGGVLYLARPSVVHCSVAALPGVALFGAATVVFGSSRSFTVSLLALVLLGIGDMVSVYIRGILVQLEMPDGIRDGSVSAAVCCALGGGGCRGRCLDLPDPVGVRSTFPPPWRGGCMGVQYAHEPHYRTKCL